MVESLISAPAYPIPTPKKVELYRPTKMAGHSDPFSPITFPALSPLKVNIFTINMQRTPAWHVQIIINIIYFFFNIGRGRMLTKVRNSFLNSE